MPEQPTVEGELRARAEQAALAGLDRLQALFCDPQTGAGDVLKGLSLLLDRLGRPQEGGGAAGDIEVRLLP